MFDPSKQLADTVQVLTRSSIVSNAPFDCTEGTCEVTTENDDKSLQHRGVLDVMATAAGFNFLSVVLGLCMGSADATTEVALRAPSVLRAFASYEYVVPFVFQGLKCVSTSSKTLSYPSKI